MIKRIILIFLLALYSSIVHNSSMPGIIIVKTDPIRPYDKLVYAVNMVEAMVDSVSFDTTAYNQKEEAYGAFQVRQIRLDDYYSLTGIRYSLNDMYDYEISKSIFLYYAGIYKDHETIAKKWNGSGPMTEEYWKKIKMYL